MITALAFSPKLSFFSPMIVTSYSCRTPAQIRKEIKEMNLAAKEINKTPESARAFLIKHGFITKSGKLTKRYGG